MKNKSNNLLDRTFSMFAGTAAQAKVEIQWWHAFGGRLVNYLMNK